MLNSRHVNQKPARQRDMRCNARALFGNRFFGDLNEYLLSLAKQVCNGRLLTIAASRSSLATIPSSVATSIARTTAAWLATISRWWRGNDFGLGNFIYLLRQLSFGDNFLFGIGAVC